MPSDPSCQPLNSPSRPDHAAAPAAGSSVPGRLRARLGEFRLLFFVVAAAALGVVFPAPALVVADRHGIDVALFALVLVTAFGIRTGAGGRIAAVRGRIAGALVGGLVLLPALAFAVSFLVPPGPLRDGVRAIGVAPAEIASVATVAIAAGDAAIAAVLLIGSTLVTVVAAGPLLALVSDGAHVPIGRVALSLVVVVVVPFLLGAAGRRLLRRRGGDGGADRFESVGNLLASVLVAVLVWMIAAAAPLDAGTARVAVACVVVVAGSAVFGALLGRGCPRPVQVAFVLPSSMRDFAVAASIAAAAFGTSAAAPLAVYGIVVMVWGACVAAFGSGAAVSADSTETSVQ